jgi:biopolymer transport protein ExbB
MGTNELAQQLGNACYVFLAINFLWGVFCAIVIWRRLGELRFRSERQQEEFADELKQTLAHGDYANAQERCEADGRALPQLMLVAINNRDLDGTELRQLLGERLQRDVLAPLENYVNWIYTVIRNGPLLGLFGTVLGMMAAFGRIGLGEKVEPAQIADEISVALICTAMGLGTAIPLGYIVSSLNIRITSLRESLTTSLVRLLNVIKPVTG